MNGLTETEEGPDSVTDELFLSMFKEKDLFNSIRF